MKKVFLAIAFLFAVTMNGFSQSDTVYIDLSDSNYFTYPEDVMFDSMVFYFTNASSNMVATEQRHTDTQLVVYGVVISALNLTVIHPSFDTSLITFDGTERTRLYKPGTDGTMTLLGEGVYNVYANTPYYLPPYTVGIPALGLVTMSLPLYETYFDDVAVVADSFYIGSTLAAERYQDSVSSRRFTFCSAIAVRRYWNGYYLDPTIPVESRPYSLFRYSYDNGNSWRWSTMGQTWEHYTMMFGEARTSYICYPILTPDPNRDTVANPYHYPWDTVSTDTTQVDTTHNGIAARLLERYINVYPTVADGGAVSVLSSFHLEGVEVYDAAGRMLSRQPASGVATTVDVSQLPAGSYVLRVNTVSGSTTKKFLKR